MDEQMIIEIHPLDMAEILMHGNDPMTLTKSPDPKVPGSELTTISITYRQTSAVSRRKGRHIIV